MTTVFLFYYDCPNILWMGHKNQWYYVVVHNFLFFVAVYQLIYRNCPYQKLSIRKSKKKIFSIMYNACPKPGTGHGIPTSFIMVFFFCSVIVRFVDISRIHDHHCLNFLFISVYITILIYIVIWHTCIQDVVAVMVLSYR